MRARHSFILVARAADLVRLRTGEEEDRLAEDVERVHELLVNAPAVRAWRRRGYPVLCRAHPDRVHQKQEVSTLYSGTAGAEANGCHETVWFREDLCVGLLLEQPRKSKRASRHPDTCNPAKSPRSQSRLQNVSTQKLAASLNTTTSDMTKPQNAARSRALPANAVPVWGSVG